jgi:arylsulfatase A-like enzyme
MRSPALLVLVLLSACAPEGAAPPHVVLITVDTLRPDHLSLNGYARETSPHIDAFAAAAWHYPDAVTVIPKTGPSITTHMTGVPPCEHQVTANRLRIPAEVPMLAERLRGAGYRTAAFVSNPVLSRQKGYARGFDVYREFPKEGGMDALNASFAKWSTRKPWERPTFVWIHYIDPHGPYTPPAEYEALFADDEIARADGRTLPTTYEQLERWPANYVLGAIPRYQLRGEENRVAAYTAWYDAEIRYMDEKFGEVVELLRAEHLFDDALVLFTADHGESLGEHDYWFEHGWFPYEATARIPMIVKPPGQASARTIDQQVSNLDTVATILDAANMPWPPELSGSSLIGSFGERGPLLVENTSAYPHRYFGVRTAEWKFLHEVRQDTEELYDLSADPHERTNVLAEHPDEAGRLRGYLERMRADCRPLGDTFEVMDGLDVQEQIEMLGY